MIYFSIFIFHCLVDVSVATMERYWNQVQKTEKSNSTDYILLFSTEEGQDLSNLDSSFHKIKLQKTIAHTNDPSHLAVTLVRDLARLSHNTDLLSITTNVCLFLITFNLYF